LIKKITIIFGIVHYVTMHECANLRQSDSQSLSVYNSKTINLDILILKFSQKSI